MTIGHNQGPTNEEKLSALRECQRAKRAVDEANGLLRAAYKRWKAAGINLSALRATMRASNRDVEEVARDLRDTISMMALRNMPVRQEDLFGEGLDLDVSETARGEDEAWGAEDDGYRSGRSNVPVTDNPCEPETDLFQIWAKGWYRGQASLARELGENAKAADPSRARPARKASSRGAEPMLLEGPREPKRKGRPAGSKNKPKDANGADTATIN